MVKRNSWLILFDLVAGVRLWKGGRGEAKDEGGREEGSSS